MYTSGSTGKPKGVLVRHRNVVNYLRSLVDQPGLGHDDVALAVTTHAFDISVGDLFAPLIAGARVVIASNDEATDVRRLGRLIGSSGATYLNLTPVTWQALVEAGWTGSRDLVAISGGDRLSEPLARQLRTLVGQLWVAYGPDRDHRDGDPHAAARGRTRNPGPADRERPGLHPGQARITRPRGRDG